jgi:tetratricopeptide (TPR) repeat protein
VANFIGNRIGALLSAVRPGAKKPGSGKKKSKGNGNHRLAAKTLNKGRKEYNQERYRKAEEFFREATELDDNYALAHYFVGLSMYKVDDVDAAIRSWKRAIEVAPHSEAASKAQKKIQHVRSRASEVVDYLESRLKNQ